MVLLGVPAIGRTAESGQLDSSQNLFAMFAALEAAGENPVPDSPSNHPLRTRVRNQLKSMNIQVLKDLKEFFEKHRQPDPGANIGQYVSFALTTGEPPEFKFLYRKLDLPPDVIPLDDLPKLMKRFYEQAKVADLWANALPEIEKEIERYHGQVAESILQTNVYLKQDTSGVTERRFQIFLQLLGPPNQVQTRSYDGGFFVVVTPSAEVRAPEIRTAYLQFLIDPLTTKHSARLMEGKALGEYAIPAPGLAEPYKKDFLLLASRSLVRAIEARLSGRERPSLLDKALREGFILTPFFNEQLAVFEKQEQAFHLYFPEMIGALDLKKEDERLVGVKFYTEAEMRALRTLPSTPQELSDSEKAVMEAEQHYERKDFEKAKAIFAAQAESANERRFQAKGYFGLARIALQQRDPEVAQQLFQRVLDLEPEPFEKSWSLVYLGRLSDALTKSLIDRGQSTDADAERERAVSFYRQVLGVPEASEAARKAAESGINRSFQK